MIRNITIGVLLAVDLLLCILCLRAFRSGDPSTDKQHGDRVHKTGYLESVLQNGVINNSLSLDGEMRLTGRNGETRQLKDLVADSAKLFVRISDLHCEECVRFILLKLIRLSGVKSWPDNRVVILGSYQNIRTLFIYADQIGIRFPVYNIEQPDIPAERINAPYCFVMDSMLQISHLFFPDKYEGDVVNFYLDLAGNRYWPQPRSP